MIRWICDWLGTASYDRIDRGDWFVLDVRHHVDKAGNDVRDLRKSIDEATAQHRAGRKIIVACDFGISRSNAIAVGILSVVEGLPFGEALGKVVKATGEQQIKIEMLASVRAAVGAPVRPDQHGTVLVTGGSGFIGRRLILVLSRTHQVVAPRREELDLECGGASLIQFCWSNDVRQIVHLAYPRVYTNPQALGISLTMMRVLIDICKALDIRFIFVSGSVVFSGYSTQALEADETLPLMPKGSYGEAKYIEEMFLAFHLARRDIRACVCRLAPVYGPGGSRPRFIRTFVERIASGKTVATHRYRNGAPSLDLLHVDDAAAGLAAVVRNNLDDTFHFGRGELVTTIKIAEKLSALLGTDFQHEEIEIDDDTGNIAMLSGRALSYLGWKASVDIDAGLAEMVRSLTLSNELYTVNALQNPQT